MPEFPSKPNRTRVPTGNPDVFLYRFAGKDAEVGQDVKDALETYLNFFESRDQSREKNNTGNRAFGAAKKFLQKFANEQIQSQHLSILRQSKTQEKRPWRSGSDSRVFTHKTEKYVFKYSVLGHRASPEIVQYYKKKYELLKHLGLAEHVPQSVFLFGETRRSFDEKHPSASVLPHEVAITIQRRIRGKTFKEMSPEERARPKVMKALREAHTKYIQAKHLVEIANVQLKKRGFGVDIALNLGNVSNKTELSDQFIIQRCISPNIVYDESTERVFFIDFDYGTWSSDKEEVYNLLMQGVEKNHPLSQRKD